MDFIKIDIPKQSSTGTINYYSSGSSSGSVPLNYLPLIAQSTNLVGNNGVIKLASSNYLLSDLGWKFSAINPDGTFNDLMTLDANGNLSVKGEVCAFGSSTGGTGSGGGLIQTVFGYNNLGGSFDNSDLTGTFNAYTINQLNSRLVTIENTNYLTGLNSTLINTALGYIPYNSSNPNGYITSSSLYTKTSQLTNDSGFITISSIPTKISQLTNDSGFITGTPWTGLGYITNSALTSYVQKSGDTMTGNLTTKGLSITNGSKTVNLIVDANGYLSIDNNLYSSGDICAFGAGSGSTSGNGLIQTVYSYSNLGGSFNNTTLTDTFNAYTINSMNNRLISVENGALTQISSALVTNALGYTPYNAVSNTAGYITISSLSSYLPLAGGTMTGLLQMGTNGISFSTSNSDIKFQNNNSRISAGMGTAQGVNVGNLLISNSWSDDVNVPQNGAWIKGTVIAGNGRFNSWYQNSVTGTGQAVEIGVAGGIGQVISYDRTAGTYQPISMQGSYINFLGAVSFNSTITGTRLNLNSIVDMGNNQQIQWNSGAQQIYGSGSLLQFQGAANFNSSLIVNSQLSSNTSISVINAPYTNVATIMGNWAGASVWGFGNDSAAGGHTLRFDQIIGNVFQGATDVVLKLGTKTVIDSGSIGSQSVNYSTNSSKLYSTDSSYNYVSSNPYFGYLTYNSSANRWRFAVSPATPANVEVNYSDLAGTANYANNLGYGCVSNGSSGWSYLRFTGNSQMWDIGVNQANGSGANFEIRPNGGDSNRILFSTGGVVSANEFKASSHIAIGLNTSTYNSNRAELDVITTADDASDIWLGTNSVRRWALSARGSVDSNAFMLFNQSGILQLTIGQTGGATFASNVTATGEITAYTTSDKRLKKNIKQLNNSLDIINKLNPVSYNWNTKAKELNSTKTDKKDVGVIAQELEKILPNLVHDIYGGDYLSVDYIKIIPYLIGSIKELTTEINKLKNK